MEEEHRQNTTYWVDEILSKCQQLFKGLLALQATEKIKTSSPPRENIRPGTDSDLRGVCILRVYGLSIELKTIEVRETL